MSELHSGSASRTPKLAEEIGITITIVRIISQLKKWNSAPSKHCLLFFSFSAFFFEKKKKKETFNKYLDFL